MENSWTIRGRAITDDDIPLIRQTVSEYFDKGRKHISRELCHKWRWYQPNGATKDMACRYILLFLEEKGLIKLPPGIHSGNNDKKRAKKITLNEIPLSGKVGGYPAISLKLVNAPDDYKLWNSIVHSYHYQGHRIIVGKFLKYMAYIDNMPIACIGWGSPAWSLSPRDSWIGWDKKTKDKNLGGIVNNIRFLILPWIRIKYLASHLLGLQRKMVPRDWFERYKENVYLLETFVEADRFKGTCYKAANWIYLGRTKGSSKRGSSHCHHGNIKDIYVYPLREDFRTKLMEKSL